ncbi:hemolysin family protein [Bryobacter aggregatus]|uniref:hemolysin family protein n=1 Tax=Bryobacter aggregatus TaxID=360054 RepID=UPI0004E11538|nr:hemolysin family protein [Bryobacter aggregatus]
MTLLWGGLYVLALIALTAFSFIQLLYLESLRLRSRDSAALDYFKSTIAPDLDMETDHGALVFSLYKHGLLVLIGILSLLLNIGGAAPVLDLLEGILVALLSMAVFSYLLPQLMYRRASGHFLRPMVPLLRLAALLMRPFAAVLNFAETLAEISQPPEHLEEGASPQEEIDALIAAGEEEGLIEEGDKKLIQSVVAFGDKRVREVMTARPNIVAIEGSRSVEELRRLLINEQFSRVPIYEGDIDHISGFVHVKDLFEVEDQNRAGLKAADLKRPIAFVPETKLVTDLLKEMQKDGNHMTIVVDEYGATAGLATMEDLMEEVFGEIRDEHEPGHDLITEADGAIVVSGSFDVDHLRDLVEFSPSSQTEATTAGGLATEWFGRVPLPGETMERDGLRLEILASDERRVERLRLSRAPIPTEDPDAEEAKGEIE